MKTIRTLQAGRGVAAFAVVLHHAALSTLFLVGNPGTFVTAAAALGRFGVDFFFVLSGFIIYTVTKPHSRVGVFVMARLRRIFPAYLPVACAVALLYTFVPEVRSQATEWSWLATFLLWPHGTPALSVAWTLQHELVFYAIMAAGLACGRTGLVLWAWGGLIAAVHLTGLRAPIGLQLIDLDFIFGVGAGWLYRERFWAAPALGMMGSLALWLSGALTLSIGVGFASLTLWLALREQERGTAVPGWLLWLGAVSYPLYLVHSPLQSALARLVAGMSPAFGMLFLSIVPVAFAALYARCVTDGWGNLRLPRFGILRENRAP